MRGDPTARGPPRPAGAQGVTVNTDSPSLAASLSSRDSATRPAEPLRGHGGEDPGPPPSSRPSPGRPHLALPSPSSRSTPFSSGSPPSLLQISTKSCGRAESRGRGPRLPRPARPPAAPGPGYLLAQAGGLLPHVPVASAGAGAGVSARPRPRPARRPRPRPLTTRPAAPRAPPPARPPAPPRGSVRRAARGPWRTR